MIHFEVKSEIQFFANFKHIKVPECSQQYEMLMIMRSFFHGNDDDAMKLKKKCIQKGDEIRIFYKNVGLN